MNEESKSRLGRGLDALLGGRDDTEGELRQINLERIEPNPYQPREDMEDEELKELAASIEENGVLQPVILTPASESEGYRLVAGERRWRAARLAGLETIPAVIRDIDREEMMEVALIENIHREDLNPLEEARAYEGLREEFDMTQAELASRLGRSRSAISNTLRLLQLTEEVQEHVSRETLSAGQARALAGLSSPEDQIKAAKKVIDQDMSVREAEELAAEIKTEKTDAVKAGDSEEDVLQELDKLSEEIEEAERAGREKEDEELLSSLEEKAIKRRVQELEAELKEIFQAPLSLRSDDQSWHLEVQLEKIEEIEDIIARLKDD